MSDLIDASITDRPELDGELAILISVPESERIDRSHDIPAAYCVEVSKTFPGGCIIWGKYRDQWIPNVTARWLVYDLLRRLNNQSR